MYQAKLNINALCLLAHKHRADQGHANNDFGISPHIKYTILSLRLVISHGGISVFTLLWRGTVVRHISNNSAQPILSVNLNLVASKRTNPFGLPNEIFAYAAVGYLTIWKLCGIIHCMFSSWRIRNISRVNRFVPGLLHSLYETLSCSRLSPSRFINPWLL